MLGTLCDSVKQNGSRSKAFCYVSIGSFQCSFPLTRDGTEWKLCSRTSIRLLHAARFPPRATHSTNPPIPSIFLFFFLPPRSNLGISHSQRCNCVIVWCEAPIPVILGIISLGGGPRLRPFLTTSIRSSASKAGPAGLLPQEMPDYLSD